MAVFRAAFLVLATAASLFSASPASAAPGEAPAAPCLDGIAPLNPYIDNCAIPNRPPHVLGSAPDQTAIINCSVGGAVWRAVCLSQYVNGGPYPGFVVGFG